MYIKILLFIKINTVSVTTIKLSEFKIWLRFMLSQVVILIKIFTFQLTICDTIWPIIVFGIICGQKLQSFVSDSNYLCPSSAQWLSTTDSTGGLFRHLGGESDRRSDIWDHFNRTFSAFLGKTWYLFILIQFLKNFYNIFCVLTYSCHRNWQMPVSAAIN